MKKRLKREIPFHLMLLLPMLFLAVFSFAPLFGILMAFQDYIDVYKRQESVRASF